MERFVFPQPRSHKQSPLFTCIRMTDRQMMYSVYLITGSNLGDRGAQLQHALDELGQYAGKVVQASKVYETEAWGREGLPPHLNQAVLLETGLEPPALLVVLQQIEHRLGRVRQERWGIRSIDIDIIYFEDRIIDLPQLKVPHPLLQERNFVLVPLVEIAAGWVHPLLQKTNATLLKESPDQLKVIPLPAY
jgi:2-amino-4-hydroxy-6-hydroxymethyldihydropteridine diphosphokinase